MSQPRAFDLLIMPIEGVAAYWLSLHRLSAGKKSFEDLARESEFAAEPFTAYLLDIAFSAGFSDDEVSQLTVTRARLQVDIVRRRLELMRICVLDVASGENPRRTYARMAALYTVPPIAMDEAVDTAQNTLRELMRASKPKKRDETEEDGQNEQEGFSTPDINHLDADETLIPALLFFVVLARRHSKMAARTLLPRISSAFFSDAMMLLIDGFDETFVRSWLSTHMHVLVKELNRKMELSERMAMAIRNRREYDDTYRIARAYLR